MKSVAAKLVYLVLIIIFAVTGMAIKINGAIGPATSVKQTARATRITPPATSRAITARQTRPTATQTRMSTSVSRTTATGVISQISVTNTRGQVLLKAPTPGVVMSVGSLFDLINTNNSAKTSNFLVFVQGNPPSSQSAGNFGLTLDLLKTNVTTGVAGALRNLQVTVMADDTGIVQLMQQYGTFPKTSDLTQALAYGWQVVFQYTINNFTKILLYFQLPPLSSLSADIQSAIPQALKDNWQQRFYLVDPWPQTSPIVWNKNLAPEQVCRAYRLLMDWVF